MTPSRRVSAVPRAALTDPRWNSWRACGINCWRASPSADKKSGRQIRRHGRSRKQVVQTNSSSLFPATLLLVAGARLRSGTWDLRLSSPLRRELRQRPSACEAVPRGKVALGLYEELDETFAPCSAVAARDPLTRPESATPCQQRRAQQARAGERA